MKAPRLLWFVVLLAVSICLRARSDEPHTDVPAVLPASVQIRNVQYGLLLRPRDANNADGTPLVLYPAQPWKCMTWTVKAASAENGWVASLKNRLTAKTFAETAGGVIKQTPFRADQTWKFEKLADGNWRILDPADGKALTARDEETVALDAWKDAPGQRWEVLPAPEHLTM